jgi:hypothetical protein
MCKATAGAGQRVRAQRKRKLGREQDGERAPLARGDDGAGGGGIRAHHAHENPPAPMGDVGSVRDRGAR